jgi:hypothetical protein
VPEKNWVRLGKLLVRQRIELDPRYVNRQLFANERCIGYRTVGDIERGRRSNYEEATIAAVETAYAVTPGSVAGALAGGELTPLPPRAGAAVPRQHPGEDPVPGWFPEVSQVARRLFPRDRAKQLLWSMETEPEEVRSRLIEALDEIRGGDSGDNPGEPGTSGERGIA